MLQLTNHFLKNLPFKLLFCNDSPKPKFYLVFLILISTAIFLNTLISNWTLYIRLLMLNYVADWFFKVIYPNSSKIYLLGRDVRQQYKYSNRNLRSFLCKNIKIGENFLWQCIMAEYLHSSVYQNHTLQNPSVFICV